MTDEKRKDIADLEMEFFKEDIKNTIEPASIFKKMKYIETDDSNIAKDSVNSDISWKDYSLEETKADLEKKAKIRKQIFYYTFILTIIIITVLLFIWAKK